MDIDIDIDKTRHMLINKGMKGGKSMLEATQEAETILKTLISDDTSSEMKQFILAMVDVLNNGVTDESLHKAILKVAPLAIQKLEGEKRIVLTKAISRSKRSLFIKKIIKKIIP
ncbi:hypothetical protein M3914_003378 [Vibrio metschnikovii]|nr:hypothetical protein [Vibrio metschnikovii]